MLKGLVGLHRRGSHAKRSGLMKKKRDWSHAVQLLLNQCSFGHSKLFGGVDLGEKLLGGDFS